MPKRAFIGYVEPLGGWTALVDLETEKVNGGLIVVIFETVTSSNYVYIFFALFPILSYYLLIGIGPFKEVGEYKYPGWQLLFYTFLWAFVGVAAALAFSILTVEPFWLWSNLSSWLYVTLPFFIGFGVFLRCGGVLKYPLRIEEFKPFLQWLKRSLTA